MKYSTSAALRRSFDRPSDAIQPSALALGRGSEAIDKLPRDVRDLVYEFGWSVVRAFLDNGVPVGKIRHLIWAVQVGAREAGNARPGAHDGAYTGISILDEFLCRHGSEIPARTLVGLFRRQNLVILPREPSPQMVEAADVPKAAIQRAIRAGEKQHWPFLDG